MTGKNIGYKRVSSTDQSPERQLPGILIHKMFIDFQSAKQSTNRPQLQLMLEFVREDDVVYVHSMDRLARNVKDLRSIVDELVKKGAKVHFIKENLIFSGDESAMSNLLLNIMGAFAEFELSFIKERQAEGIAIAKKKGKYKGRKKSMDEEKMAWLKEKMLTTRETKASLARQLKISVVTLDKYLKLIIY